MAVQCNAHGIVRGIGLVICIYINPETKQFWLIDYECLTLSGMANKVDHVQDMLKKPHIFKAITF